MNTMHVTCNRTNIVGNAVIGDLYIDNIFFCNTLEDLPRETKVENETCIPCGEYKVGFREVLTPMTKKYRDKYGWFKYHLEIKDIPNFLYVYFHIGNTPENSSGCVLLGDWIDKSKPFISNSTKNFEMVYSFMSSHLENGGEIIYTINDLTSSSQEGILSETNKNKGFNLKFWK